jgi:anti-sigma B factor antagonist
MTIHERPIGNVTILDIDGRITVQEGADVFRDAVQRLVSQGRVKLVLNLASVPYIDSTALGEVVRAFTTVVRRGGLLKLVQPTRRVHDLLVITKLVSILETFETEVEAISSFGGSTDVTIVD